MSGRTSTRQIVQRGAADRRRVGFSLLEVSVASLIVGVVLAAALNTVGSATSSQFQTAHRTQAYLLAHALMAEILALDYQDPIASVGLGREVDELASTTRAPYDDVDDYEAIGDDPPVAKDGTALTNVADWSRSVDVDFVRATDLTTPVLVDEGAKRIVVSVYHDGQLMAQLTAVVTNA